MKISSLRSSFQLAIATRDHELMQKISTEASEAGYQVKCIESLNALQTLASGWIPHFIVLSLNETHDPQEVSAFKTKYRETKILGMFSPTGMTQSGQELVPLLDGFCRSDFQSAELLLSLDRLSQVTYLEQINEELIQANEALKANEVVLQELSRIQDEERKESPQIESLKKLIKALHGNVDHRDAIENYFDWFSGNYPNVKIVWFNFVAKHFAFTATIGRNISQSLRGLGFKVSRHHQEIFKKDAPFEDLLELQEFVQQLFGPEEFGAHPIFVKESLAGLMVVIGKDDRLAREKQTAHLSLEFLKNYLEMLFLRDKQYQYMEYDLELGILNRKTLQRRIFSEISRSRRQRSPLSLLLVGFDRELTHRVTKALIRLTAKHLRPYDLMGVWGSSEVGILLPHTPHSLAAAKADELRKLFQSVKGVGQDSLKSKAKSSYGISEHPSCATDAEDLAATANEALLESQRSGSENIVLSAVNEDRDTLA